MFREWSWTSHSGLAWKLAEMQSLRLHLAPQSASLLTCTLTSFLGVLVPVKSLGSTLLGVRSPQAGAGLLTPHPVSLLREVQGRAGPHGSLCPSPPPHPTLPHSLPLSDTLDVAFLSLSLSPPSLQDCLSTFLQQTPNVCFPKPFPRWYQGSRGAESKCLRCAALPRLLPMAPAGYHALLQGIFPTQGSELHL